MSTEGHPEGMNDRNLTLVIHTEYGVVVCQTTDRDEIAAASMAIGEVRTAKRRRSDYREQKREEAA